MKNDSLNVKSSVIKKTDSNAVTNPYNSKNDDPAVIISKNGVYHCNNTHSISEPIALTFYNTC